MFPRVILRSVFRRSECWAYLSSFRLQIFTICLNRFLFNIFFLLFFCGFLWWFCRTSLLRAPSHVCVCVCVRVCVRARLRICLCVPVADHSFKMTIIFSKRRITREWQYWTTVSSVLIKSSSVKKQHYNVSKCYQYSIGKQILNFLTWTSSQRYNALWSISVVRFSLFCVCKVFSRNRSAVVTLSCATVFRLLQPREWGVCNDSSTLKVFTPSFFVHLITMTYSKTINVTISVTLRCTGLQW